MRPVHGHRLLQGCPGCHCGAVRRFNRASSKGWYQRHCEANPSTLHQSADSQHCTAIKKGTQKLFGLPKHLHIRTSHKNSFRSVFRGKKNGEGKKDPCSLDKEWTGDGQIYIGSERESHSCALQDRSELILVFAPYVLLCCSLSNLLIFSLYCYSDSFVCQLLLAAYVLFDSTFYTFLNRQTCVIFYFINKWLAM